MIAGWMIYCVAVGALLIPAAFLLEKVAFGAGGPTRRVWSGALLASVAFPVVALLRVDGPVDSALAAAGELPVLSTFTRVVGWLAMFDPVLIRAWMLTSALVLTVFGVCLFLTGVRRRRWVAEKVDGVPVLLSEDAGPAIVGMLNGRIVLPAWAARAEREERTLMLRHEQEHLAAGDPRLLFLSGLLVILMPWNVPMWFMARRLRLAVEVDCDRRVLRSGTVDPRTYGMLLLSVGRRASWTAYAGAGFARSRSTLERRIDRMTTAVRGGRPVGRWSSVGMVAAALLIVLGAWTMPQPVQIGPVTDWNCLSDYAPVYQPPDYRPQDGQP